MTDRHVNGGLKPLKQRLTKHQQFKRRQKMHKSGTWRQQMETDVAKGFGALAQRHQQQGRRMDIVQRYNLLLMGVNFAALIGIAGRTFGWW